MPHKPSRRTWSNYSKQPFLRKQVAAAYSPRGRMSPPGISWGVQSEAMGRSDSVPLSMLRPRLTSANHTVISR